MIRKIVGAIVLCLFFLNPVGMFVQAAQEQVSRLQLIQDRQQLQVCVWPEYYSISYRDPRTQKLSGLDIDLAQMLAQELGVQPRFVDSSFASLIPDLLKERCDVAMFAVGITPDRQQQIAFTQPHLVSDVVAITTKSNRRIRQWADLDQPGNVLAVAKGTWHEPVMKQRLQHATLVAPDFPETRETEVLSGRADAFVSDFPYSLRMLETTDWAQRIEPDSTFHLIYYAWAVKPNDPVWLERLDEFMRSIKEDGRLLEVATKFRLDSAVVLDTEPHNEQ
ncbi:MAG TPA: ABC transporter substrate-binding protein [Paenalcaligenes sp.]|nr:ABC transporter substrate-binding protein [Paenalcaligenes sp.]